MHPRSSAAAAAVASISILILTGCGSGRPAAAVGTTSSSTAGGAGTAATATTPATATTVPTTTAMTPTAPSTAGTPTTPQTAGTAPTSDAGPVLGGGDSCSAVDVRLERLPGVASGTTFFDLIVTNHGSRNCTLPAQPKLTFLGANYKPVQVTFGSEPGGPTFLLGPNLSAAMSVGYSSASQPPCDAKIAWVQVTSPAHDVPFDGRTHCQTDTYHENHWMPGTYAQPQ